MIENRSLHIQLLVQTSQAWTETIMADFDTFLIDHAACERKASATGINFIVQYPDKPELIQKMLLFAREELVHFQQVCELVLKRGLQLGADEKNFYVRGMQKSMRPNGDGRFLDRLLVTGLIEARGTERFQLVGEALTDVGLKTFYLRLAEAEARHHDMFVRLALKYFSKDLVTHRLNELLVLEAELVKKAPLRAAVH